MAVTRKGRSIVFTAASDAWPAPVRAHAIRFNGTGLTVGQILVLKEGDTNGAVIARHIIEAASEDRDIWYASGDNAGWVRNPFVDAFPASGGQVLIQLA